MFKASFSHEHGRPLPARRRLGSLSVSRVYAALGKRFAPREGGGRHEFALQAVWRSGLSGSLDVDGRSWALSPRAESGVWLTWRRQ